jgi:hypothetical protein
MGEIGGYTGIYWEMMGYDRNYRTKWAIFHSYVK